MFRNFRIYFFYLLTHSIFTDNLKKGIINYISWKGKLRLRILLRLVCVCMCKGDAHMLQCMCRSEDNLQGLIFLGHWALGQVPSLPSHLAGPIYIPVHYSTHCHNLFKCFPLLGQALILTLIHLCVWKRVCIGVHRWVHGCTLGKAEHDIGYLPLPLLASPSCDRGSHRTGSSLLQLGQSESAQISPSHLSMLRLQMHMPSFLQRFWRF